MQEEGLEEIPDVQTKSVKSQCTDTAMRFFPWCWQGIAGPVEFISSFWDNSCCQSPRRARATFPIALHVSRSPAAQLQSAWLLSDPAPFLSQARF